MIVAGSRSQVLASRLARAIGDELAEVEYDGFPVVASTPDDSAYVELLQIVDACGCGVDLVLPYMGYSRQDSRFEDGEPVTARAVARGLPTSELGSRGSPAGWVETVTTVNLHEENVLDWFGVDDAAVETHDLDASPLLCRAVASEVESPVVLSPDSGAVDIARNSAESI
ncbi:MAG: ribose-phosphate pyrophosphokinase-like domain-containing protein, partial [Halobacteria archaeon]|nr:ribose-phosphate pyrophosphokinase-like domain-containing protein [Halobacteria archaeon]